MDYKPIIKNIVKPLTFKARPIKFKIEPEDASLVVTYMKDGKETTVSGKASVYLKQIEEILNE